ncbi:hypothetical protein EVAR_7573_1 [Eumeta japonica]|uniref:Uncharacterized protein n=1 Tax=Eumeta variegata TaxID=151549 RepID=A0A4C1VQ96_EUMVA|nr:hypothetical protein EVAR_7573_1 [Eumeta japonica]
MVLSKGVHRDSDRVAARALNLLKLRIAVRSVLLCETEQKERRNTERDTDNDSDKDEICVIIALKKYQPKVRCKR